MKLMLSIANIVSNNTAMMPQDLLIQANQPLNQLNAGHALLCCEVIYTMIFKKLREASVSFAVC